MLPEEDRSAFIGEFVQKEFNDMQLTLNSSLEQYIINTNIDSDIQNVSLSNCELIYSDDNGILIDINSNNKFNIIDK